LSNQESIGKGEENFNIQKTPNEIVFYSEISPKRESGSWLYYPQGKMPQWLPFIDCFYHSF
jgi:hypothetical protein